MVCIDRVYVCDIPEFFTAMNQLGIKVISQNLSNGQRCLSELCFEPESNNLIPQFTPIITKIAFLVLFWLILHLFYSLIPSDI